MAGRLISAGGQALLAGDLLLVVADDPGYRATSCAEGAATVAGEVRALLSAIGHIAGELADVSPEVAAPPSPSDEALRSAAIGCMRRAGDDEGAQRGAMAVVVAGEWVQNLARLTADLERPAQATVDAARIRWWR